MMQKQICNAYPKQKCNVYSDATAAIGICRRKGLGKVRHLDCTDLWVQESARAGRFAIHKVDGEVNPATYPQKI